MEVGPRHGLCWDRVNISTWGAPGPGLGLYTDRGGPQWPGTATAHLAQGQRQLRHTWHQHKDRDSHGTPGTSTGTVMDTRDKDSDAAPGPVAASPGHGDTRTGSTAGGSGHTETGCVPQGRGRPGLASGAWGGTAAKGWSLLGRPSTGPGQVPSPPLNHGGAPWALLPPGRLGALSPTSATGAALPRVRPAGSGSGSASWFRQRCWALPRPVLVPIPSSASFPAPSPPILVLLPFLVPFRLLSRTQLRSHSRSRPPS